MIAVLYMVFWLSAKNMDSRRCVVLTLWAPFMCPPSYSYGKRQSTITWLLKTLEYFPLITSTSVLHEILFNASIPVSMHGSRVATSQDCSTVAVTEAGASASIENVEQSALSNACLSFLVPISPQMLLLLLLQLSEDLFWSPFTVYKEEEGVLEVLKVDNRLVSLHPRLNLAGGASSFRRKNLVDGLDISSASSFLSRRLRPSKDGMGGALKDWLPHPLEPKRNLLLDSTLWLQ